MNGQDRSARGILATARAVAVLGASDNPDRPANYVPSYLARNGFEVYPVNPILSGETLFDRPVAATLAELQEPIDVVEVFRRSEHLPDHLPDILAMRPPPRAVWFQTGIRNDEVARDLEAAGIAVVQDRCMLAEHVRLKALEDA